MITNKLYKVLIWVSISLLSLDLFGQQDDNLFENYYYQNRPNLVVEYAKNLYEQQKETYTLKEYCEIGLGAVYYKTQNNSLANEMADFSLKGIEPELKIYMDSIKYSSFDVKKEYIIHFLDYYEFFIQIYNSFVSPLTNFNVRSLIYFYHYNIYGLRHLFSEEDDEEVALLLLILQSERFYASIGNDYKSLFSILIPEYIKVADSLPPDRFNYIKYTCYKAFEYDVIACGMKYGFIWKNISGDIFYNDPYIGNRVDYYIKLKEYESDALSVFPEVEYDGTYYNRNGVEKKHVIKDWKDLQNKLSKDEAVLLLFKNIIIDQTNIQRYDGYYYNGYYITSTCKKPFELANQDLTILIEKIFKNELGEDTDDIISNYLLSNSSKENNLHHHTSIPKKLYICPYDDFENIDLAYCDNRIVMIHSIEDINKDKDLRCYNGGIMTFYGDIDYGSSNHRNDIQNFNKDKDLLSFVKDTFKGQAYSLTGNKVKKINFLNLSYNTELFHISTHGEPLQNHTNSLLEISGDYSLALSYYNADHVKNSISAEEIRRINMTGVDLVYLDACNTAKTTKNSLFGGNNGLSKAFYIAGVSNIICNLNNIDEHIAYDFTSTFYQELVNDIEKNYHDVFYRVKKQIIEKYKNVLVNDPFGRPDLGIVLWE